MGGNAGNRFTVHDVVGDPGALGVGQLTIGYWLLAILKVRGLLSYERGTT